ncbi:aldo/keto reductase [Leeia oryzae]|uniref:aldo/keto reductase n=1 Tax=Leeia oryzae TaxID=356662 RepID=UPI00037B1223|nr:aldo/keto reductase [Leeia oryzae]
MISPHAHAAGSVTRSIGPFLVPPLGLGCMNLSHAYGTPLDPATAANLLLSALEAGVTLFDTAALYGFGANETLLGKVLSPYRHQIVLASKCGMTGVDGRRVIDGRPAVLTQTCDQALKRLNTDTIDLYYLHRWDRKVPIEESVGALSRLVEAGKIRAIGLSEVSSATIRRAHAIHPIAAVQTEYSVWTRNAEISVLATCQEIGAAFVAFSPLGRGYLANGLSSVAHLAALPDNDIRHAMPRFAPDNFLANESFRRAWVSMSLEKRCTPAQLALAWLLHRCPHIIPIPGTTSVHHLQENLGALSLQLSETDMQAIAQLCASYPIHGNRYNESTQSEIDTES